MCAIDTHLVTANLLTYLLSYLLTYTTGKIVSKRTDFYDVMPPAEHAVRQRHVTSGNVARLDEMRLAVGCHVVEADDGPRDHVADDDDDEYEQVLEHISVSQQNALRLARLKLGEYPVGIHSATVRWVQ